MAGFKFIYGCVTIHVMSGSRERFINMCHHRKICLEHVISGDEYLEAVISARNFRTACEIAKKTGNKIRIKKKKGIPFIAFRYRKHYSFVAGVVLCMAFIYICSLFLFNITFSGNSNLTTPVLTRYLESIGVKNGCRTACIDCNDIEKKMREDFDEITWVAAAVKGNHLYISIKENDSFEGEIKSTEIPENIIASDDGTIESIITRNGTPLVKKGDNVEKGQVLVSGVVNICDDSGEVIAKRGVTADADVLIKTEMIYSDELSEKYENKVFTGKTRVNAVIRAGKYIISIGPGAVGLKLCDKKEDYTTLKINDDLYLPVSVGKITYYEYKPEEYTYSDEEASAVLNGRLARLLSQLNQKGVQIADERVKIFKNNDIYTCEGALILISPQTVKENVAADELAMPDSKISNGEKKESN